MKTNQPERSERPDELGQLGQALRDLAWTLESRYRELQKLDEITAHINAGLLLDDVLNNVYRDFRQVIPYNRIGLALLEEDGRIVRERWAKSDRPDLKLGRGFSASLAGSSLETIIATDKPRIINDLIDYLAHKPESESTRLVVAEGVRSSLTCPLIANGVPIGFLFFSSFEPNTYADAHVQTFERIAEQLSVIVEKGRLVSELVEQKAAIERQNEELRRLNELKNTFLGMAAHDLRNPIATIQMIATVLLDESYEVPKQERQSFLKDINWQSEHMLALINDLLDVTQIESGKLVLNKVSIELQNFLAESVSRHAALAAPKGTHVLLDNCPAGTVMADPRRLRQVMDNLISNGVNYSPSGSAVRVSAQSTPLEWRVAVQDQGPGIAEKDRQRLFQDFARLSAQPIGGEKSTGLGLAITRRVVNAHGGQIGVDSEPGRGASFWFTLPISL